MMTIDTTNMCSHLQKKLFEEDGIYHPLWMAMQDDPELTAVVRSRQLLICRGGKKVLVETINFINYPNSWSSENPLGFAAWLVQEHACMIGRVVTGINFC